MKDLGVNLIRLGAMWPGMEPERNQYNMTYIKQLEVIAEKASEYRIYTLLDMHQDILSEYFCGREYLNGQLNQTANGSFLGKFPSPKQSYLNFAERFELLENIGD